MTDFLLVRHCAHDLLNRTLTGRTIDVGLNDAGFRHAAQLAAQLALQKVDRILSSPRLRALQTAQVIGLASGLAVETANELDEIDFGRWDGLDFEQLEEDAGWCFWNQCRSLARPPEGESMCELQSRIVTYLQYLQTSEPTQRIALVTHAEPIRAAILYERHVGLDNFAHVQVHPGSVHELALGPEDHFIETSGRNIKRRDIERRDLP